MKKYKVTLSRLLCSCISYLILLFGSIILFFVYLFKPFKEIDNKGALVLFIVLLLFWIFWICVLPIVINYLFYKCDQEKELLIDKNNYKWIYRNEHEVREISFEDIEIIREIYDRRYQLNMYYYRVLLKDKSVLVFTSLLIDNTNIRLKGIPYERYLTKNLLKLDDKNFIS